MRSAKIGTILPWGGDGGSGFTESNIPKGWITCKGDIPYAHEYPLLAAALGDTYGGNMTANNPVFPYTDSTATFGIPNLSGSVMVDLEPDHLDESKYDMGQTDFKTIVGSLVSGYGDTVVIGPSATALCDITFTLNIASNLYFTVSNIKLSPPNFQESVFTINRKLGMMHTPRHGHSDTIKSVRPSASGPLPFTTDQGISMSGNVCSPYCAQPNCQSPITCAEGATNPTNWNQGITQITYYGDNTHENTLPSCGSFMEFVQDGTGKAYWSQVPAGASNWRASGSGNRGSGQESETYTQQIIQNNGTLSFTTTPDNLNTHSQPTHTGYFPRPMKDTARPNFLGYNTGASQRADGLADSPELAPAFSVALVPLQVDNREVVLPAGTDIRRDYSVGSTSWKQWDKITPMMYVTVQAAQDKYKYLREGTMVESVERTAGAEGTGIYTVKLTLAPILSGTVTLVFRHGAFPSTMNLGEANKDPLNQAFDSHNHGSFEIVQGAGSMAMSPNTLSNYTTTNADGSSISADTLDDALNINCNLTQPSCTITYIIKAY